MFLHSVSSTKPDRKSLSRGNCVQNIPHRPAYFAGSAGYITLNGFASSVYLWKALGMCLVADMLGATCIRVGAKGYPRYASGVRMAHDLCLISCGLACCGGHWPCYGGHGDDIQYEIRSVPRHIADLGRSFSFWIFAMVRFRSICVEKYSWPVKIHLTLCSARTRNQRQPLRGNGCVPGSANVKFHQVTL